MASPSPGSVPSTGPVLSPGSGGGVSFFDGEALLRMVATAVVRLSQLRFPGDPVYPDAVQSAFNHLVLLCLRRGVEPPRSIPDMAAWAARKPLGEWPLGLADDIDTADRCLVDRESGIPTQDCFEWAVSARDAAAEQFENQLIIGALTICRAARSPESYTAFRRLLTERPVLTGAELAQLGGDLDLGLLHETIRLSYEPAPAAYLRDGVFTQCARCRCLLVPVRGNSPRGNSFRCELDRCRHEGGARAGQTLDPRASGGVHQLSRPLRMFITGPGLAETELESALVGLGLAPEMWPNFDAYDLRITFPDGQVWAVDVKDRANPALLGRGTRPFRTDPPFDRAFLVVPRYRFTDREDYGRVFVHHRPEDVAGQVELLTDHQLAGKAGFAVRRARQRKGEDRA